MKKLIFALLAAAMISTTFAGGMGSLYLAIGEAVAEEFVTSNSTEDFYALMDNMEITGKTEAPNCDIVYVGKTVNLAGENISFDACVNIVSRSEFIIAISENQSL